MNDAAPGGGSAGALLRAARERQGLHIAALAAAIKVAPRKLDALEHDRWSELPDATFVRALAQTVCRTLKIDARPVLDLLPPVGAVALEPVKGTLNTPFRERPGRDDPPSSLAAFRPMIWGAGLLVLGAGALYFVPERLWRRPQGPAAVPAPAVVAAPASAPAAAAGAVDIAGSAPGDAASAPVALAASGVPAIGIDVAAAPATASPPPTDAATPSPASLLPAETPLPASMVQLRTSQSSWIEARDAHGQLLLSRPVLPGEAIGLDGVLPIKLTIGNAAVTQLAFRGETVDLAPSTRNNVARLELK